MTSYALPFLPRQGSRRNVKGQLLWLGLPLATFVALRGDTRDTETYIETFYSTTAFPWNPLEYYSSYGMEWGYGITSWLLSTIGLGPRSLFFIISFASFYFLQKAARRVGLGISDVAPYYLGSFFLVQQLMQVRQGLAATVVLFAITLSATSGRTFWRSIALWLLALCTHITSALPLVVAKALDFLNPPADKLRTFIRVAAVIIITIVCARLFMSLGTISALGRLSVYAVDQEYSAARGLLDPANVRALVMLAVFSFIAPVTLLKDRAYAMMLGLYAAHVGVRLGFFDFLILSGRLSTALGIVEVLLLPMLVRTLFRFASARIAIGSLYMLLHAYITLSIQAPYLLEDYFSAL